MEERFGGKLTNLMIAGGAVIFVNMVLPLLDSLTNMAISAVNKTVNQWQLDMELDRREAEAAAEEKVEKPAKGKKRKFVDNIEDKKIEEIKQQDAVKEEVKAEE